MPPAHVSAVVLITALLAACAPGASSDLDPAATPDAQPTAAPADSPEARVPRDEALREVTGTWYWADGDVATRSNSSFEVHALRGHEHCDWGSITFLSVLWPVGRTAGDAKHFNASDTRQYIRDPRDHLGASAGLRGTLDLDADLPPGSVDTGFSTDSVELWLGPDGGDRYAYLVFVSRVERWPRAAQHIACA